MKNKFLLLKISIVFLILMFLSGCVPKDTTPPSVSITSPLNNATVSGSVDIIASATDDVGVSKVEFYIDGTKVGEDSQAPYEYSWNTDSLQYNSTHSIKAKAYDNAGNVGESQVVTVTIGDPQAPQVTIANPNDGDTVSGIVSIEATVVDKVSSAKNKKVEKAPSGILKVEFYVDGTKVGEDSQAPYEYSWNTDLLQYGSTHSIKAKAYDNAGNVGESQVVTVTIGDPQAPQVTITNPNNGDTVSGIVSIEATVVDKVSSAKNKKVEKAPSGISKVEFYVDGTKVGEATQSPYVYSWNTTQVSNGGHTIKVKAYDNAGNVGESQVVTVTIGDPQAPQVTIANPNDGDTVSGIVSIEATVVDKVSSAKNKKVEKAPSGILKVEFYVDGTKVGEDSQAPYEYSWNTDLLQYGSTHSIKAKAYDNAGNTGESQVVTVTIGDTQAPQVTITNPNNGDTVSGIVSIEATVVDKIPSAKNKKVEKAPSGILKVEFYVDGTKVGEDSQAPYVYSWNTDSLQYGSTHSIKAKAYDNAGNTGESQIVTVTIGDPQAPQVTITNPNNGDTVSGIVSIEATVVDKIPSAKNKKVEKAPSGILKVEFYIDGTKVGEDTQSPYEYSWNTTQVSNEGHTIKVKAIDNAGNSDSATITVYVNNSGVITWQKTYGGSYADGANSIQQTRDGGYIAAGYTKSYGAGGSDVYILKLNASGNLLWQKTFGGSGSELAYSIQQTTDGGYIVAGYTDSFGAGSSDIYVLKLDESGNATWTKTFGGSTYDYVGSIQQTTDGGYIVAGWTASSGAGDFDAYILKLDESGNTTWTKTFGGSTYDYAYSIQQTTDGGYIVAGTTLSFGAGNADGYVLKLDENGNLLWDKTFGGSDYDYVYSIQQTTDGGYIVAGSTSSFGVGYVNVYVLKLDENGNLLWDKTFGRSGSNGEAHSIKQVADGGYIVAGTLNYHAYVLKLDENGNLLWEKTFGGSNYDHAYSIQQTTDGGYIVAGSTSSFGSGDFDAYVLKLDENGNTGPYPTISKFQLSPSPLKKR